MLLSGYVVAKENWFVYSRRVFIVGLSFLAFYNASGSYVDEDGLLVEEFWALALGSFTFTSAIIVGLISSFPSIARSVSSKKS